MIKFTGDYPSNHESNKLPILDVQVQMNAENRVLFEFYEKETKTDKVILASSAMSWHQKFQILTNEALRRLRNTSPELGESIQNFHLSRFSVKMKDSGYSPKFRSRVIRKAKEIYNLQVERDLKGEKPLYRSRELIMADKHDKKENKYNWWRKKNKNFNSVLFVPPTPGGVLAAKMKQRAKEICQNSKMKIKIIESGGTKLKDQLMKKNPFKTEDCHRSLCPICKLTPISDPGQKKPFRTHCATMGVGYRIACQNCAKSQKFVSYEGESGRPARVRFMEHVRNTIKESDESPLVKHQKTVHPGEKHNWKFSILKTFHDPLLRQCDEGVRIAKQLPGSSLNSKSEINHPPTNRIKISHSSDARK